MKKFYFTVFIFLFFAINSAVSANESYDRYNEIYYNLPHLEIHYKNNEDPDEFNDYLEYYTSPYPLIRISDDLYCKKTKILHGYYLLTPRNKDGHDVVLFKQNGKIAAIVPVFEKNMIDPLTVYKEPPKPKTPLWKKPFKWMKKSLAKVFGRYKKPPKLPRNAIEAFSISKDYYEIDLYVEEHVYKMLFRTSP
jgi:hypothetical protein